MIEFDSCGRVLVFPQAQPCGIASSKGCAASTLNETAEALFPGSNNGDRSATDSAPRRPAPVPGAFSEGDVRRALMRKQQQAEAVQQTPPRRDIDSGAKGFLLLASSYQ